ncbi:MAG TPA: pyruvate dehydrogenase (acetyl-transferring) E1 component subunit alpha [Candidatus Nanoarchaeia archaeon]|nr:pyruvate dehydrogenase (acetyl-transferring) E1 component subunit alpha [Candidatus Nanoarchaeia archaeon]
MRKEVASFSVKSLQILDENGKADKKLEPKLPASLLLTMYKQMVTARLLDQKFLKMQRAGRMGTFAPVTGQEAAQVGSALALDKKDWMVPSFREVAAALALGVSPSQLALYPMGYPQSLNSPPGLRILPVSIPVGSQILHAVGLGMAMSIKKEKSAALVYFGDGATSEGDFSEGLNFAGVYKAPVVFLCQNNGWAISLPRSEQTAAETIAQKAIAYGFEGVQVDGNDVLAMYVATNEALKKAKSGKGPTLIEAVTYRMMMHTTADDPTRYRSQKEVDAWAKKDPIVRFRKYLEHKKLWNPAKEKKLLEDTQTMIDAEMAKAESTRPQITDMFTYVYEKMPAHLVEQQETVLRYAGGRK